VTFVLSALTQHEVIQVSDRRLSSWRNGQLVDSDDEKNKAVLFCGRLMFGVTGVAELGHEGRTDLWLAERICDVIRESKPTSQSEILLGLAGKATRLFAQPGYQGRAHAFVGAGWGRFNPHDPDAPGEPHKFQPYVPLISNFHDSSGEEQTTVSDTFSVWVGALQEGKGGVFVFEAPRHLSPDEKTRLIAELAYANRARDRDAMVNAMAGAVIAVAERDEGVGKGLMINCLPRSSLGSPPRIMALASMPSDAQTFLYVPPSGDTVVQLGPVTTCGGGISKDFRAEPLPADEPPIPWPGPTLPDDPPGLVRRWYLAPIILEQDGPFGDAYSVETYGRGGSFVIPTHEEGHARHGDPEHDVALALVSSDDHGPLEADERIYPIADLTDLDRQVDEMDGTKRAWIDAVAQHRQVSTDGSVREVVRRLGQQLQPDFDESKHWVQ
jgi:hypothetical protein